MTASPSPSQGGTTERSPQVCVPPAGKQRPGKGGSPGRNPCFCSDLPTPRPGLQRHLQGSATGNLIEQTGGEGLRPSLLKQSSPWEASLFYRTEQAVCSGQETWGADLSDVAAKQNTPLLTICSPPPPPLWYEKEIKYSERIFSFYFSINCLKE